MVTCLRFLTYHCLLFGLLLPLAGQNFGNDMEDGLAIVTTAAGNVSLVSADGSQRHAELHDVEYLTGVEMTTGEDGYIFLPLSNGCALGIYKNSKVRFESYQQRPFTSEKENLEYEPSFSKLIIRLHEGSLSFSAERISPLSEIIIRLPLGEIDIHKASGRVTYNDKETQISISSGIVTFAFPGIEEEEFINGPMQVRISEQSAVVGEMAEVVAEPASARELTNLLVQATQRANERVIFKALPDEASSIPRPYLVADPEALLKPTPRPYSYSD